MNLSTECLQASQVDSLLQGNLTPEEYESAQDHLELCETCRARVEATIGPEQWWSDVQSVLLNSRTGSSSQRNASSTDAEPNEPSTAKLLDLLGPTDDPNMLGRIGPYEIIGLLGQGGMGAVFKGFDLSLNRFVAIKMLLPHLAASGAARKRFAREGQAVAAVVDDHVMAIHCVDEWQGVPYLVMTYSRGVSLQKRLSDNGPLEVREILRIGMQAAKGLAAAHVQGIVHRDIKPANIFLDQNVERVQLMDFGLARAVDDASLTRSGTLAGTPQYMSPEQARAETVDHRSDLFSLGSVMYAMCTGHAPFRAESSYSVLRLITDKEPRPIREVNPDVPDWLCTIIGKLMAKEANVRFESAKEVADLLEDCLAYVQQPTIAALPDGLVDRSVPRDFSFRSRTIGVFAMFAVVCSIIVAMLLMQSPDKPNQDGVRDAGGVQVALTNPADARDAGMANLTELLEMQKLREKSLRQLSLIGNIRQTQQIETKRIEGESNEEYIKRYTSPDRSFDGLGPFPMLIERDYTADLGHIRYGDLNGKLPIMFREWFFKRDVFTQLIGVEAGRSQATITRKPADELRQPWSGWIRADVYTFRPILDHELSIVLEKAAHTPGIPDPAGRPLFHLDKKKSADQKVQWIATFLHQEPSEVNGRTAFEHLWYRVFWEQVDKELLITRVDELSVVGDADSMPLRVALVDDYRTIDSIKIPHRVRTYMFANPSGMLGAEFVASEVKVNDAVDMPTQLRIPPGTSVTDKLTGKKYRQPIDVPKSPQDSPHVSAGHSGSTTINPDISAVGNDADANHSKDLNGFLIAWDFNYPLLGKRMAKLRVSRDMNLESVFPGRPSVKGKAPSEDVKELVELIAAQVNWVGDIGAEYERTVSPMAKFEHDDTSVRTERVAINREGKVRELQLDKSEHIEIVNRLWRLEGIVAIGGKEGLAELLAIVGQKLSNQFPEVRYKLSSGDFRFGIKDEKGTRIAYFRIPPDRNRQEMDFTLTVPPTGDPKLELDENSKHEPTKNEDPPPPPNRDARSTDSSKIYTVEEVIANGMELSSKQLPITVRVKVVSVRQEGTVNADGTKAQHWWLSSKEYNGGNDPSALKIRVSENVEKALERIGVTDLPVHFTGKELTITGKLSIGGVELFGRDTIWLFDMSLDSLDQLILPVAETEHSNDESTKNEPPQPNGFARSPNSPKIYTVEELIANGMELSNKQQPVTVRVKVVSVRQEGTVNADGTKVQHWWLSSKAYNGGLDPSALKIRVSENVEKVLARDGVTDLPAHFTGKELTITGKLSFSGARVLLHDDIRLYRISLDSLNQLPSGSNR